MTLVFGTAAAGLPDLHDALAQAFGEEFLVAPAAAGANAFTTALERLDKRRRDGLTLLWVGADTGWPL